VNRAQLDLLALKDRRDNKDLQEPVAQVDLLALLDQEDHKELEEKLALKESKA